MTFEEFKARYEKHLKNVAFKGTDLPVSDEEMAKIYLGLIVLEEYKYEVQREQRKRQIRER